jgi:hypothetical protein
MEFFKHIEDGSSCVVNSGMTQLYYIQGEVTLPDERLYLTRKGGGEWGVFTELLNESDSEGQLHMVGLYENEQQAKAVAWDRACNVKWSTK